jgi:NAD(P)-dependent dehydrogenase (short-subunit alcohol dehydrogenase family)
LPDAAANPADTAGLSGQVALVTGSSSGLGERFARVLSGAGARVVLTARRTDRLERLRAEIERAGGCACALELDVTDPHSISGAFACAEREFGPVSILVITAGMNVEGRAVDLAVEDYDRIMDTNVRGAFLAAREAARSMIARGKGGRIINIASIGAQKVLPGLAAYCMSKAALVMMTKALAREWARHDINVNAICPGYILTEINQHWFASEGGEKQKAGFPRRRLGEPSDLDSSLLLLASPQNRFMTGAVITVDDGQSLG